MVAGSQPLFIILLMTVGKQQFFLIQTIFHNHL
nr:MAG TPA: hypothetical protein [Caudoviricetes sp.]